MDYMMLHNLFYIVFRKEDFNKATIVEPYSNIIQVVSAGEIEAYNEISGGEVDYQATNGQVSLKPGFKAGDGVAFSAKNASPEGCYYGGYYRVINTTPCNESKNCSANKIEDMFIDSSLNNEENSFDFDIFPNPADQVVNIEISAHDNCSLPDISKSILITDISGRLITELNTKDNSIRIDLALYKPGVYFVMLIIEDKSETKKLIVN
jgi:hypothetical protein